jgi:hypothetical protein
VLPYLQEFEKFGSTGLGGLRKEKRMSENSWYVLKIASLILAVMGMTVLVMTIMMGQNGAQGY